MAQQTEAVVKFAATADPTGLPAAAEGTYDTPAMTLAREQFVAISSGGPGVVADVIDDYILNTNDVPLNVLATAAVLSGQHPQTERITKVSAHGLGATLEAVDTINGAVTLGSVYALDLPTGDFYPIAGVDTFVDDVDPQFGLAVASIAYGFNDGTGYDQFRVASAGNIAAQSGLGAQITTKPGDWSITHTPAAGARATITRAAGGAGVRHVCTSITAKLVGVAAIAAPILVNLRDGATGAGTILWSAYLFAPAAGSKDDVVISGLNIPGSDNTALTLEFAAAGGAGDFESVAMTGYDVS